MTGPSIKSGSHGADVRYWQPAIWGAMWVAHELWKEMFPDNPFIITCGVDGEHKQSSAHYTGRAGDVRSRDPRETWSHTTEQRTAYVKELRTRLGDEFDVTVSLRYKNYHIELDPKRNIR